MCQIELCLPYPPPPPPFFFLLTHGIISWSPTGILIGRAVKKKKKSAGRAYGCWTTVPISMVSPFSPMAPVFFSSPFVHVRPSGLYLCFVFRWPVKPSCSRRRRWLWWLDSLQLFVACFEREKKKLCVNVRPYMFPSTATQASVCRSLLKERLGVSFGWVILSVTHFMCDSMETKHESNVATKNSRICWRERLYAHRILSRAVFSRYPASGGVLERCALFSTVFMEGRGEVCT